METQEKEEMTFHIVMVLLGVVAIVDVIKNWEVDPDGTRNYPLLAGTYLIIMAISCFSYIKEAFGWIFSLIP